MLKTFQFFILFLIQLTVFSGQQNWTSDRFHSLVFTQKVFFIGKVIDFTVKLDGKPYSKQEFLKYTKNGNERDLEIKAKIFVVKALKGEIKEKLVIELQWEDLYDSMCPHPKTNAIYGDEFIWYSRSNHTLEKPSLSVIPIKYKNEVSILASKDKQYFNDFFKMKVDSALTNLNNDKLTDSERLSIIYKLAQIEMSLAEKVLITKLNSSDKNANLYIRFLASFYFDKKIKINDAKGLNGKLKIRIQEEIEKLKREK